MDQKTKRAHDAMRHRSYGEVVNTGLLSMFEPKQRVLDIGCGTGTWAPALRAKGAEQLVGVEFASEAANQADRLYDRLVREPIETLNLSDLGGKPFDTIIVADVIEHLVDPWRDLRRWTDWVSPAGQLVISVPNLQHFRVVRSLLRGHFDYADEGGVMDRTHLRWFTKASLKNELGLAGWRPIVWGKPDGTLSRQVDRLTLGRFGDFLIPQLRVVARPQSPRDPV